VDPAATIWISIALVVATAIVAVVGLVVLASRRHVRRAARAKASDARRVVSKDPSHRDEVA
jgi:flagellar basal body-associated protein FliL